MAAVKFPFTPVFFGLLLFAGFTVSAQDSVKYYLENHPRFLDDNNDTLVNAYAGGLYNPQFANYDLNNNGRQDLVVLDRQDHQILTFLQSKSEAGEAPHYFRAPEYEAQIPSDDLTMNLVFKDYNGDGRKDLFHITSYAEVRVYKNVSDPNGDELEFELVTTALQSLLPASNDTSVNKIYAPRVDISGFTDVDGDGDLDILAFGVGGGYVRYYKNQAVEKGKPLDSLDYILADRCWGCFNEFGATENTPSLSSHCVECEYRYEDPESGDTVTRTYDEFCGTTPEVKQFKTMVAADASEVDGDTSCTDEKTFDCNDYPRVGKKKHAGATLLPFDADADGDIDLIYGDANYDRLVYMENGREDFNHPIDSFVAIEKNFPAYDKPVNIQTLPGLFQVDVNGDGVKDLVAAPQDRQQSQNLEQVWYYKNVGTGAVPEYEFQRKDFLQTTMIDLGGYTHPAFYDYDQDGDQDLFVATGGNYGETGNNAFRLVYYENINTAERPVYQKRNDNFLDLKGEGLTNLAPAFGDLNGNGQKDLVVGHEQGVLLYYENTGTSGGASFVERTKMLDSIDVGWSSVPSIADIDGDGRNDLVIGTEFSKLHYYRNTGENGGNPGFELETEDFGAFDQENLGHISPTFGDLTGDDSLDLVLGTEVDGLRIFDNIRSVDSGGATHYLMTERDSFVYYANGDGDQEKLKRQKLGHLLRPAIANLDDDTVPDMMIGGVRGGLVYLGTRGERDSITTSIASSSAGFNGSIQLYPNPTEGVLQVDYEVPVEHGELRLSVYDLTGRNILTRSLEPGTQKQQISLSGFSNSLYSVVIANEQGQVLKREKVVLRK